MTRKDFAKLLTELTALAATYGVDFHAAIVNAFTPLAEKYGIDFNPAPVDTLENPAPATPVKPAAPLSVQVFGKPVTPPPDVDKPANPDSADK